MNKSENKDFNFKEFKDILNSSDIEGYSQELWNMLENMETTDIQVMLVMVSRYLVLKRNVNKKEMIKDIKKFIKW